MAEPYIECVALGSCGGVDLCCNCSVEGVFHGSCGLSDREIIEALQNRCSVLTKFIRLLPNDPPSNS